MYVVTFSRYVQFHIKLSIALPSTHVIDTWDTGGIACSPRQRFQGKLDVFPRESHLHELANYR